MLVRVFMADPVVRNCAWCKGPIPSTKRRDAQTCSQSCRQARSRFRVGSAGVTDDRPIRVAYADPPYPGRSVYYPENEEVDHGRLLRRLCGDYPDGWALSTSADALRDVLSLCPDRCSVRIWVRNSRGHKRRGANNKFEPLIVYGGRPAIDPDLDDVLLWRGRQNSHPDALVGMKPAAFCEWMFRQLGLCAGDQFEDLYPGSGAVQRAWDLYASREYSCDTSRLSEAQADLRRKLSPGAG